MSTLRRAGALVTATAALGAALLVGAGHAAAAPHRNAAASTGGHFTAVAPFRALDTRVAPQHAVSAHSTVTFAVTSSSVPATASSVTLNITATDETAPGYLTAYAAGTSRPTVSNVNFSARQTVANLTTVATGSGSETNAGKVTIYNGSAGTVDIAADVSGYFAPGSADQGTFTGVTPTRVLDTRHGIGAPQRAVSPHSASTLKIATGSLVPQDASAVVLNVTETAPTAGGYATAYPYGSARPASSNINFSKGVTAADLVVVPIGDQSSVSIYNGSSGSVQFLADVQGYLMGGDPVSTGGIGALTPSRDYDSRKVTPVPARSTVTLNVLGRGGVPASEVSAVVFTLTVTEPGSGGYLTAYGGSSETPRPTASNLNFVKNQTLANSVVVAPDADGQVTIFNGSYSATQVIVDVADYALATDLNVPTTTASHYTTNFSALAAEGSADGKSTASLVLLDVGAQSVTAPGLSRSNPGVVLARKTPRYPATYPVLVAALQKYVTAFGSRDAAHPARIAVGTNTDGTWSGTNGYAAATRGQDWAQQVVNKLDPGDNVTIVGADDIEAGFAATETQVEQWERSFLATTSAGLIYNGSLDACPDVYGSTAECQPVASDNGTHAWTRANYVALTHGLSPARITVLPQIYYANNANQAAQWINVDASASYTLKFEGALSQRPICGTASCGYTGSGSWAALYHALSTHFAAPNVPNLPVATELYPT